MAAVRRRLFMLAAAVSVVLCAAAVALWLRGGGSDPAAHLSCLAAATTAEAERRAMDDLWLEAQKRRWSLSLAAQDASGAALPMSDPDWATKVVTVDLVVDGRRHTHRVVDAENLFLLM